MERWIGKVAVVTGASSGIGAVICRQLVKTGMIVVGLARREDRLQEMEKELKGKFYYVKTDLCREDDILAAFSWIKSTLKSFDVLINNAGVWKQTDLLGNTNDWKLMFDTNVMALNICSREAVKIMKELNTKEGHIININSILGHFYATFMKDLSVYGATKFSVTALTESLRELMCVQNLPIRVTSISPGVVKTEMTASIGHDDIKECMLKPIDVAEAVLYVLGAPHRVNVSEIILTISNNNMKTVVNALD